MTDKPKDTLSLAEYRKTKDEEILEKVNRMSDKEDAENGFMRIPVVDHLPSVVNKDLGEVLQDFDGAIGDVQESVKNLEKHVHFSSFVTGFSTCVLMLTAPAVMLMGMGYRDADLKGECAFKGRNIAVRMIESTLAYETGCKLGKRRD